METAAKKPDLRSTDRVLEALSTLAALLDRTIQEMKSIDSEFQDRLLRAVHDTEASLQSQTEQHLEQALAEWETERTRINKELERSAQMATLWEAERNRLNAEIERLRTALAVAQAHTMIETRPDMPANSAAIVEEMDRAQKLIREISAFIEDPTTALSTVIRKNVERAELEAYLKGIRYAFERIGG